VKLLRPSSFFSVAPGVVGLRSALVNYYFIDGPDRIGDWVLVDAGLPGSAPRLRAEAQARYGHRPPRAIILTHGHFDHVGSLAELLKVWDAPVFAHERELPFLNRHLPYPAPDPSVGGGLMTLTSPLFPRRVGPFSQNVTALPPNGIVPGLPGWQWVPTAGHAPGHVSLWREEDRVMLAGDAVVTTRQESAYAVWSQRPEIRPPPAYFTPNWSLAFDSIGRIRGMRPLILASGHGQPAAGPVLREGLARLADDFPTHGLPRHGYYVKNTWAGIG
jgi:glyoxylase-like metal-dependent hydrolase (beta-lactamase superfamily II)